MADRRVSSGAQAVLWRRALPSAQWAGTAEPCRLGDPRVSAVGTPPHLYGHELVCDQAGHHPLRPPVLSCAHEPDFDRVGSEPHNRVTPNIYMPVSIPRNAMLRY